MMEKRKRYRIADAEIEIAFTENYTEIICRDYEVKAEGKPDFVIEVTDEEVEKQILAGENGVFDGVIETNTGETVGEAGKTLDDATITGGINWYFKNVTVVE